MFSAFADQLPRSRRLACEWGITDPAAAPLNKAQRKYQRDRRQLYNWELQEHTRGFQLNLLLLIYQGHCNETHKPLFDGLQCVAQQSARASSLLSISPN